MLSGPHKSWTLAAVAAALLLLGCQPPATVITKNYTGRRVADFEVEGDHVAYVWYPAQHMSIKGQFVLLNLPTGEEVVLEEDLNGPMAMARGKVVWWDGGARDDEGKSDLMVYDVAEGISRTLAHEKLRNLDTDGGSIVWEEPQASGSDIVLFDLQDLTSTPISTGGSDGSVINRNPAISDGLVAWEAYDRQTKQSSIVVYTVSSGDTHSFQVAGERPILSVSGSRVVYTTRQGDAREVHLYDVATKTDQVIASLERLSLVPYVEEDQIVWGEHIRREDFKKVPGQPLIDEKDFRDLVVYNVRSGSTRVIAKALMCNRAKLFGGRVYAAVYRELPPPGASNLVVPTDLWMW